MSLCIKHRAVRIIKTIKRVKNINFLFLKQGILFDFLYGYTYNIIDMVRNDKKLCQKFREEFYYEFYHSKKL